MKRPLFRIEQLHIQSFRGIDDLRLVLPRNDDDDQGGLAVLLGDNGCGKTAILEAILLVLGSLDLLPADTAPIEEQVKFGATSFSIDATVCHRDGQRKTLRVDTPTIRTVLSGIKYRDLLGEQISPRNWGEVVDLDANVQYFSARREPEALGETAADVHLRGARSLREARRVHELKKKLVNTYYRAVQTSRGGELPSDSAFVRIQKFIQQFLGKEGMLQVLPTSNDQSSDFDVVLALGEIPKDITSLAMAREEAPKRKDIPSIVPIDRLSTGQVSLFAFAGPLVFRDVPADVVLIDEPEQHLHVQWQRHILPALRELSPESQFIITTHSLDIADSAFHDERLHLQAQRASEPSERIIACHSASESVVA